MKSIVIGSGLAGLTATALLAKQGYEVRVYERHKEIGGVTGVMIGADNVIKRILKDKGKEVKSTLYRV